MLPTGAASTSDKGQQLKDKVLLHVTVLRNGIWDPK